MFWQCFNTFAMHLNQTSVTLLTIKPLKTSTLFLTNMYLCACKIVLLRVTEECYKGTQAKYSHEGKRTLVIFFQTACHA